MALRTPPPTKEYLHNWEVIFGKKKERKKYTVEFISQFQMENKITPDKDTAVISIVDPGSPDAKFNDSDFAAVLRLNFDDLYEEAMNVPVGTYPDEDEGEGRVLWHGLTLPDARHARMIINFLDFCDAHRLVVHCHAGISRSAAVAQFAADAYGRELDGTHKDTSCANARLLRLLNKVHNDEDICRRT